MLGVICDQRHAGRKLGYVHAAVLLHLACRDPVLVGRGTSRSWAQRTCGTSAKMSWTPRRQHSPTVATPLHETAAEHDLRPVESTVALLIARRCRGEEAFHAGPPP